MAAADPSKLSYFSFPGEVRNQIMDLIFVPGDVYVCNSVPDRVLVPEGVHVCGLTPEGFYENIEAHTDSQPGFQLMATCKQAYHECHSLFYSSNTFQLPATMTFDWSDRLQAKHKAMIKRIDIEIGLDEPTQNLINELKRRTSSETLNRRILLVAGITMGTKGIAPKMRHIAAWTSLKEIGLRARNGTIVLQHYDVVAQSLQIDGWGRDRR